MHFLSTKSLFIPYCSCAWRPYYSKDKEMLEKFYHTYTKMIMNMQDKHTRIDDNVSKALDVSR